MIVIDTLNKLLLQQDLDSHDINKAFTEIVNGKCTDAQIAGWLVALRMKGETASEIATCIDVMKKEVIPIACSPSAIDIVGTGGDGIGTYNISTGAAIVASSAGAVVAKHGNRALSSKSGSADILSELGVRLDLSIEQMESCLQKINLSFLFAPLLHPAMKHVFSPRRELKIRTIFNLLGPMVNPANVKRGVIGVYDKRYCQLLAEAAQQLDVEHILFVYGDGIDEFSVSGINSVWEVYKGKLKYYELSCEDVGLTSSPISELLGGSPQENKIALENVLKGEKNAYSDAVVFNAGAGLYTAGLAKSIEDGCRLAVESINSSKALSKLQELQLFMREC